jgi:hypothetical protein
MQRKSLGVILRNVSCTTPIHIAELVLPVSAVHVAQAVLRLAKVLRCVSCIEMMPDALQELGRNPAQRLLHHANTYCRARTARICCPNYA